MWVVLVLVKKSLLQGPEKNPDGCKRTLYRLVQYPKPRNSTRFAFEVVSSTLTVSQLEVQTLHNNTCLTINVNPTMTTKNNKDLHVNTEKEHSPSGDNRSPPSLSALSIPSSSLSSESDVPVTPRDQPIMTPEAREQKAKAFALAVGLQWSVLNEEQRVRARKIQSPDFTWSPTRGEAPPNSRYTTTFAAEWEQFVATLPEPHKAAFTNFNNVFFDDEAVRNYMAIRRQLSGICSAHSSVLYQHYIESCRRGSQEENHKMLDMSSFIRNDLSPDIQKRYIQDGTTGLGSFELTILFTDTKKWEYTQFHPCKQSEDEENHRVDLELLYQRFVKRQEPGLVSSFRVGAEFSESAILQGPIDEVRYQEKVNKKGKEPIHAMILIGAYHNSEDDRFWFLLQNTHKDDYFKLVDGEHLASSNATIYFAHRNIDMSLKGDYKTAVGEYSETALDMEECMGFEEEGLP